jgi:periplasmic divalent cation tolerance protein
MPAVLLTCACPDADTASELAHALVNLRLAACVQVLPGLTSIYRWEGVVEKNAEVLLMIKTWDDRLEAAIAELQSRHPYEVPEIMAVPAAGGLADYFDWVRAETR